MPFPQGPFSPSRAPRTAPAQPRDKAPVFAVGQRAFVSDPSGRKGEVVLVDASAKVALGHLVDGVEVEILAWIPRKLATLYRVQSTEHRTQGWLRVANLRASSGVASPAAPVSSATPVVWVSPSAPTSSPRTARGKREALLSLQEPTPKNAAKIAG